MRFLLTTDLAPYLVPFIQPEDIKKFAFSSIHAARFIRSLSDTDLDKYCEAHAKGFPCLTNEHAHFISCGCTCTLILASTHNLPPTAFLGEQFSDQFWRGDRESRAVERAVRLDRWCDERTGYSARRFFAVCFAVEWQITISWFRLVELCNRNRAKLVIRT